MDLRDAGSEADDRVRRRRAWMDRRQPIHLPGYDEDPRIGMETASHDSAKHCKNSGIPHGQPARSRHAPMNIGVLGLWHLGTVTAAGLATLGHRVVGLDFDESRVANLNKGVTPVFEPGLAELITRGLSSGNLRFSSTMRDATDVDL